MSLKKGTKDVSLLTKIPPNVEPKTITTNGTYVASDEGLDGYSEVEVATSGVDINEYMSDEITSATNNIGSWVNTILKLRSPLTITTTNYQLMFENYLGTSIPTLICEKLPTTVNSMYRYCKNITSVPEIDTSNCTDFAYMFDGCESLLEVPYMNTSKLNNSNALFRNCKSIKKLPQYDFSNAAYLGSLIENCSNLEEVPLLNCQKLYQTGWNGYFANNCPKLTRLGGFQNLGQNYSTTLQENYSYNILDLHSSKNLTKQSIMNVINNLYDIKTKGVKPQKLVLGTDNLAKLTEEERNIAVSKGWSIS